MPTARCCKSQVQCWPLWWYLWVWRCRPWALKSYLVSLWDPQITSSIWIRFRRWHSKCAPYLGMSVRYASGKYCLNSLTRYHLRAFAGGTLLTKPQVRRLFDAEVIEEVVIAAVLGRQGPLLAYWAFVDIHRIAMEWFPKLGFGQIGSDLKKRVFSRKLGQVKRQKGKECLLMQVTVHRQIEMVVQVRKWVSLLINQRVK